MAVTLAVTVTLAVGGAGCRCSDLSSPLVADFESSSGLGKWPRDGAGAVELSPDWKVDGATSLRIDPGLLASVSKLRRYDFRGFDALRVHVRNTSARLAPIGFELSDDHDTLHDRHRTSFGAPPGDSTIDVDLAGDLWRGEENRPFRGPTKAPIDLASITRIAFENRGDAPIYVDALTLVSDPLPVPQGAFAFDFGKRGTRVMAKTTGVFEDTVFDATRGHGFSSGQPTSLRNAATYPSPLLGDGLAWGEAVFQATLAGGPTLCWIAFERSGFWEEEATGYSTARLAVNGATVMTDTFSPGGPHFLFEDVEVTRVADIESKLVWPAHAIRRFTFDARPGVNSFTLSAQDLTGPPLRVAGMFLAPDTPEGRAYVDALEERQRAALKIAYPEADRSRRPDSPAPVPEPVGLEVRPVGEIAHPRDLPAAPIPAPGTPGVPGPEAQIAALRGHRAHAQLALYAPRDVDVTVTARPGPEPIHVPVPEVPLPLVSYGVYGPKRPYEGGAVWIEAQHYRPLAEGEALRVGPELSRSLLLTFDVPAAAAPGRVSFFVDVRAGEKIVASALVTVEVFDVEVRPLPIPVGLFMNALPFGPDLVGEARWWQWQESLLSAQGEAGLNTPTGGPGLGISLIPGAAGFDFVGDRAFRYLDLARRYGLSKAVVGYSGFLPSLKHARPDAALFQRSWSAFEKARGLPPFYVYAYDEPSTDEELAAATTYLEPFRAVQARTIGFLAGASEGRFQPLLDNTHAMGVSGHTKLELQRWVADKRHVFLYNRGVSRLSMGPDLAWMIALGAAGRLEWIGVYTQGFAFDDLDGREPSYGMFVVHDRLGVLPTPRWLSMREGLLDARLRLAFAGAPVANTVSAPPWPDDYPADAAKWPDPALEASRWLHLRALSQER